MHWPSPEALEGELGGLQRPILVLSTIVGRGMHALGEALVERLGPQGRVLHRPVEDFLPARAVREDLERYRLLSSRAPFLLNLAYRLPPIYWRKLFRETRLAGTDLSDLEQLIRAEGVATVLGVSHRPTFWMACLKARRSLPVHLTGLLGEYGSSLGWRFLPWNEVDLLLSPLARERLRFPLGAATRYVVVDLPARRAFADLRGQPGDPDQVLVVCGWWGQGPLLRVVHELLHASSTLRIHAVCGENDAQSKRLQARFAGQDRVRVHGAVRSLRPLLAQCGSVVTKPGISTLLEARDSGRKIFLLRGMPVAEDHNRDFALAHFGAERFSTDSFLAWHREACAARRAAAPPAPATAAQGV